MDAISVTDEQLRDLCDEAEAAGDCLQAAMCRFALGEVLSPDETDTLRAYGVDFRAKAAARLLVRDECARAAQRSAK